MFGAKLQYSFYMGQNVYAYFRALHDVLDFPSAWHVYFRRNA